MNCPLASVIADNLRRLRRAKRFTEKELAEHAAVTLTTYRDIESCKSPSNDQHICGDAGYSFRSCGAIPSIGTLSRLNPTCSPNGNVEMFSHVCDLTVTKCPHPLAGVWTRYVPR